MTNASKIATGFIAAGAALVAKEALAQPDPSEVDVKPAYVALSTGAHKGDYAANLSDLLNQSWTNTACGEAPERITVRLGLSKNTDADAIKAVFATSPVAILKRSGTQYTDTDSDVVIGSDTMEYVSVLLDRVNAKRRITGKTRATRNAVTPDQARLYFIAEKPVEICDEWVIEEKSAAYDFLKGIFTPEQMTMLSGAKEGLIGWILETTYTGGEKKRHLFASSLKDKTENNRVAIPLTENQASKIADYVNANCPERKVHGIAAQPKRYSDLEVKAFGGYGRQAISRNVLDRDGDPVLERVTEDLFRGNASARLPVNAKRIAIRAEASGEYDAGNVSYQSQNDIGGLVGVRIGNDKVSFVPSYAWKLVHQATGKDDGMLNSTVRRHGAMTGGELGVYLGKNRVEGGILVGTLKQTNQGVLFNIPLTMTESDIKAMKAYLRAVVDFNGFQIEPFVSYEILDGVARTQLTNASLGVSTAPWNIGFGKVGLAGSLGYSGIENKRYAESTQGFVAKAGVNYRLPVRHLR